MKRAALVSLAVLAAASASSDAGAWDTYVNDRHDWVSIYQNVSGGTGSHSTAHHDARGNEHAEIADATFYAIAATMGERFGVHAGLQCADPTDCPYTPTVVDLNASFMRPELFGVNAYGDDVATPLEERRLPPLAMWSGLPDFNYTVYDWINKSTRCPALPLDADRYELCHMYSAWLGAALNSTHMGELAAKVYRRLHAIAVYHAERAGALRQLLGAGGKTGSLPAAARDWYADYVREAEMLALAYEMNAQHFLQDRWSIGHMISRWGPGSYEEMIGVSDGGKPDLDQITSLGLLTGIVHGSLAVFGKPDPLSAPLIDYELLGHDDAKVMSYRWATTNSLYADPEASVQFGLGDYLFADVVDDRFDGSVLRNETNSQIAKIDTPKAVKALTQKKALNTCGGDGLRQVVSRFDSAGGSYGAYGITLPAPDPNLTLPGATATGADPGANAVCTDVWAANDSYYEGARTIAGASWALGDGLFNDIVMAGKAFTLAIADDIKEGLGLAPEDPTYTPNALRIIVPYSKIVWRSWVNKKHDETYAKTSVVRYGVDSAKTGTSFRWNGIWNNPNGTYEVPNYFEPEDLDTVPWFHEDPMPGDAKPGVMPSGGMDRAAIEGFFNKARTESWCKTLYGNEKSDKTKEVTLKLLRTKGIEAAIAARKASGAEKTRLEKEAERARAACAYLANRAYKATDTEYTGVRVENIGEHLPLGGAPKIGPSYEPICAYFDTGGADDIRTADASDDDKPYYLKPGYVEGPGDAGAWGHSPKTLENWCSMIPVLKIGHVDGDEEAVGEIVHDDGARWLELEGENVGIKTGSSQVGEVIAVDANGQTRSLDIWDSTLEEESGGWSYDNQSLWARIPGSLQGFDTNATLGMNPQAIKDLAPKPYTLELFRPDDPTASDIYRADGEKTVGTYRFLLHTSWVEHANILANGSEKMKGLWVTYPEWSRPQTTVLVDKFFKVSGNTYTEVDLAAYGVTVTYQDGFEPMFDGNGNLSWVAAPDKRGVVFSHPIALPPSLFDGTVSYFFAFH